MALTPALAKAWVPWFEFTLPVAAEPWRRAGHKLQYKPRPWIQTFETDEQAAWYRRIVAGWESAGSVRFDAYPFTLFVLSVVKRPDAHWRRNGELSALGLRHLVPDVTPDIDNVHKAVLDALTDIPGKKGKKGGGELLAWTDDKNCVGMGRTRKVYTRTPLEDPRMVVTAQVHRDSYLVGQGLADPRMVGLAYVDLNTDEEG